MLPNSAESSIDREIQSRIMTRFFSGPEAGRICTRAKEKGGKTAVVSSDVLLLIIRFPFDGERDATLPPQIIASTKKDNDKENGTGTRLLSVIERPSSRDSWMLALIATRRSSTECLDQQLPSPLPLLVTTIYGLTSSHFSNFAHQCSSRDSSLPTPLSR